MSALSKTAYYAKIAFVFVLRIALPLLIGTVLNWVFTFVFVLNWLGEATWKSSIFTIILTVLFVTGFPFAYYWLARINALRLGAVSLYHSNHNTAEKVMQNITKAAVISAEKSGAGAVFAGDKVKNKKGFIKSVESKLPRPIYLILSFIIEAFPLAATLKEIGETTELKEENLPIIQPIVQRRMDEFVEERLVGDALIIFWTFVGVNIATMIAAWYFLV